MITRDNPHYSNLLDNVRTVFGNELKGLNETQRVIVVGLLEDRMKAHKGDLSKVTLEEVEGVRELLYNEFSLAALQ
jgi:ATP-dependent helicase/DNAse subunit B